RGRLARLKPVSSRSSLRPCFVHLQPPCRLNTFNQSQSRYYVTTAVVVSHSKPFLDRPATRQLGLPTVHVDPMGIMRSGQALMQSQGKILPQTIQTCKSFQTVSLTSQFDRAGSRTSLKFRCEILIKCQPSMSQ